MNAYDIEIVNDAAHAGEANHGWCFGLPPGIRPEQWPLDPDTGYPLMHGFTLLLPEDYRVHGPEIVALSFFSLAPDQNDGGPTSVDGIREMLIDPPAQPPADAELRPFWEAGRNSHPRLHRLEDILGGAYALILLDAAEFSGAPCQPPALPAGNPLLAQTEPPQWLEAGSAATSSATRCAGRRGRKTPTLGWCPANTATAATNCRTTGWTARSSATTTASIPGWKGTCRTISAAPCVRCRACRK